MWNFSSYRNIRVYMNPVCIKRGPYHAFTWSYHQLLQSLTPEHHGKQSEKKKNAKDAIPLSSRDVLWGWLSMCSLIRDREVSSHIRKIVLVSASAGLTMTEENPIFHSSPGRWSSCHPMSHEKTAQLVSDLSSITCIRHRIS